MLGTSSIAGAPIAARSTTPGVVYAEGNAVITQTDASNWVMTRIRPSVLSAVQQDVLASVGLRIASGRISTDQSDSSAFDGIVFDAGGYLFSIVPKASFSACGVAIRQGAVDAVQSNPTALQSVRILAAVAGATPSASAIYYGSKILASSAVISGVSNLSIDRSAIVVGQFSAIQSAIVQMLVSSILKQLPDYSMKRPPERRMMKVQPR